MDRLERAGEVTIHLCLLLDGCVDDSAAIAEAYRVRSRHVVRIDKVSRDRANAGIARHRAMTMGIDIVGDNGLLLTTDADSAPCADWLRSMMVALDRADVVTGRIIRRGGSPNPLQDRVETYYDTLFAMRRQLDPVPWEAPATHHYAGGANIGVRANVYRALGGFAPLPCGEDARFVDDAARAGWRVRRDSACVVRTSGRRNGRVAGGMASLLGQLDHGKAEAIHVAHPSDAAWQYRMHGLVRTAYHAERLDTVAAALEFSLDHVCGVARDCVNGEAFAMRIVPEPPGGMRSVALPAAERALDLMASTREPA